MAQVMAQLGGIIARIEDAIIPDSGIMMDGRLLLMIGQLAIGVDDDNEVDPPHKR